VEGTTPKESDRTTSWPLSKVSQLGTGEKKVEKKKQICLLNPSQKRKTLDKGGSRKEVSWRCVVRPLRNGKHTLAEVSPEMMKEKKLKREDLELAWGRCSRLGLAALTKNLLREKGKGRRRRKWSRARKRGLKVQRIGEPLVLKNL